MSEEEKKSMKKVSRKKTTKKKTTKSSKKQTKKVSEPKQEQEIKEVEIITIGEELEDEEEIGQENEDELIKTGKWWLDEPWRSLLDPELASNVELSKFDLSSLIEEFTDKMLKEDLIDFRISGMAIYSSAKFYHQKISGVIQEEEKIQKEEARERLRREIPKTIAQPLRESRKLATSEELFGAMRRAIIETMQKREKLRIQRERKLSKKEVTIKKKGKGKLPAEILKHITGKEETIEERLKRTHSRIREIIRLENYEDEIMSMQYFKDMIYGKSEISTFEKKVEYIQRFEELLFLASLNKISLGQKTMRSPISIKMKDTSPINF